MRIDTTIPIKDISGKIMPISINDDSNFTLGKAIAIMLTALRQKNDSPFDKMKSYILATEFYAKNEIEIDKADFDNIKKVVETDSVYATLISGQVLVFLNDIKAESKGSKTKSA